MPQFVKQMIKEELKRHRIFGRAKSRLRNGLYCVDNRMIYPVKSVKELRFPVYCKLKFRKKNDNLERIAYSSGADKDILIFEDMVCAYFRNPGQYSWAKKNYRRIKLLNYPHCSYVAFDDEQCMVQMNKVVGECYVDRIHDNILIRRLFEYALDASMKIDAEGVVKYFQHRDVRRCNVIWTSETDFVFIDLDGIGFSTILFDLIHFCSDSQYSFQQFLDILEQNRDVFTKILERFSDYLGQENPLDQILLDYVRFYKRIGKHFEAVSFLQCELILDYPKTQELLSTILP